MSEQYLKLLATGVRQSLYRVLGFKVGLKSTPLDERNKCCKQRQALKTNDYNETHRLVTLIYLNYILYNDIIIYII